MSRINATMQYENKRKWGKSFERAKVLAELLGVDLYVEFKAPSGEKPYACVNLAADEMRDMKQFIVGLFKIIGTADSPIFFVINKAKPLPLAHSGRLQSALGMAIPAEVPC